MCSSKYTLALQVFIFPCLCFDAAQLGSQAQRGCGFLNAGNMRKLPPAATRKWARQVRWQERAGQCADEAPAAGTGPGDAKGRHGLNPNLVAAMQRAERTDRRAILRHTLESLWIFMDVLHAERADAPFHNSSNNCQCKNKHSMSQDRMHAGIMHYWDWYELERRS